MIISLDDMAIFLQKNTVMQRILLLLTLSIVSFHCSFGQYQEIESIESPSTVVRLHVLPPGILVEQSIGQNATIVFDFKLGLLYQYQEINGVSQSYFYTLPALMVQPRFYTTQAKRERLGRRTDYFSGGYVGIPITYAFETKYTYSAFTLGGVYGFQRTLGRKAYWNIAGGLGVTNGVPTIIGDFGIGFILN